MENLLILPSPDCFPALKLPPFEPWNTNTKVNTMSTQLITQMTNTHFLLKKSALSHVQLHTSENSALRNYKLVYVTHVQEMFLYVLMSLSVCATVFVNV